jgi:hypothetical protein
MTTQEEYALLHRKVRDKSFPRKDSGPEQKKKRKLANVGDVQEAIIDK